MPSSIFYTSFTHTHTSEANLSPEEVKKIDPNAVTHGQDLLSTTISFLHDHSGIITLNPLVVSHSTLDTEEDQLPETSTLPPSSSPWQLWTVTDSKPILFNFIPTTITYKVWLRKSDYGYDSVAAAPGGVTIDATWRAEGIDGAGEGSGESGAKGFTSVRVTETAKITCPRIFAAFIKSTMASSHREMHERFWERCKERVMSQKS